MHYVVVDEVGHCTAVDFQAERRQGGYNWKPPKKRLRSRAECKDMVGAEAETQFKAAQASARS